VTGSAESVRSTPRPGVTVWRRDTRGRWRDSTRRARSPRTAQSTASTARHTTSCAPSAREYFAPQPRRPATATPSGHPAPSVAAESRPSVANVRPVVAQARPAVVKARSVAVESRPAVVNVRPAVIEARPVKVKARRALVEAQQLQFALPVGVVDAQPVVVKPRPMLVKARRVAVEARPVQMALPLLVAEARPVVAEARPLPPDRAAAEAPPGARPVRSTDGQPAPVALPDARPEMVNPSVRPVTTANATQEAAAVERPMAAGARRANSADSRPVAMKGVQPAPLTAVVDAQWTVVPGGRPVLAADVRPAAVVTESWPMLTDKRAAWTVEPRRMRVVLMDVRVAVPSPSPPAATAATAKALAPPVGKTPGLSVVVRFAGVPPGLVQPAGCVERGARGPTEDRWQRWVVGLRSPPPKLPVGVAGSVGVVGLARRRQRHGRRCRAGQRCQPGQPRGTGRHCRPVGVAWFGRELRAIGFLERMDVVVCSLTSVRPKGPGSPSPGRPRGPPAGLASGQSAGFPRPAAAWRLASRLASRGLPRLGRVS
jgi:hypothetical protein